MKNFCFNFFLVIICLKSGHKITSNNKIWYRFDRGSTGYTEGGLVIFASENDPPNFRRHSVTQRTLNNNSSCPF